LESLNISRNPFFELTTDNDQFHKLFISRDNEINELEAIISFYISGTRQNTILVGESGIGKTTILNNIMIRLEKEKLKYLYFPYIPNLEDFINVVMEKIGKTIKGGNLRDRRIGFIKILNEYNGRLFIFIDNFEDFRNILEKKERNDFIEIFKRSPILFICAITSDSWDSLLSDFPDISNKFNPMMIKPFDIETSKQLIAARLENTRIKKEKSKFEPFTEGSVELISIYSFFIPRKIMDFSSKMLLRAIIDDLKEINDDVVKNYIYTKSGFAEYTNKISKRQMKIIEEIIKLNLNITIVYLAEKVGISSVAIAENIQKLINLDLIEEVPSPGKKKTFRLTEKLKILIG
jgi:ABC-type oligopeptide transport system ATPase subunit